MFSQLLTSYVSKTARRRGEDLFQRNDVELESVEKVSVVASFSGTLEEVTLECDWNGPTVVITASCSCTSSAICKHVWATVRSLDKHELFAAAKSGELWPAEDYLDDDFIDDEGSEAKGAKPKKQGFQVAFPGSLSVDIEKLLQQVGGMTAGGLRRNANSAPQAKRRPSPPAWQTAFANLEHAYRYSTAESQPLAASQVEPVYILDVLKSRQSARDDMVISLAQYRSPKKEPVGAIKPLALDPEMLLALPHDLDRRICQLLYTATQAVARDGYGYYEFSSAYRKSFTAAIVAPAARVELVDLLFQSGRFWYSSEEIQANLPLIRDEGPPWELTLAFDRKNNGADRAELQFRRDGEIIPVRGLHVFSGSPGYLLHKGRLARADFHGCEKWLDPAFLNQLSFEVAPPQRDAFVDHLYRIGTVPPAALPADWEIESAPAGPPKPDMYLVLPKESHASAKATATLQFDYGGQFVSSHDRKRCFYDAKTRRVVRRDMHAESEAWAQLAETGVQPTAYGEIKIPVKRVPAVVASLLNQGWSIHGNDQLFRKPGEVKINITSGIDWFDVAGGVAYGEQSADFGELLTALKRGERFVRLGDGSLGVLPEEWLKRHGALLGMAENGEDGLRFRKTQISLIDVLLAEMPETNIDAGLQQARQRLREFDGVRPCEPAADFRGVLRPYQGDGLGWLRFLREFGWGGCLADDMGLGKTIQVLSYLQSRRHENDKNGNLAKTTKPALVVVPRSLIFNWKREAATFTPDLRVLDFSDTGRSERSGAIGEHDLVLTTYGTLRRDIEALRKIEFDTVIIDEAQAIKNPDSLSAKSVRLLNGRHRLAMTGTPIENSLQDLWSIFEFLNPGLLGGLPAFRVGVGGGAPETRDLLHRLLRPFILRRTKDQVATDLPERSEQTIECEMLPEQKKLYAGIRDHYRQSLLKKVDEKGLNQNKIHVLEALLRLRQAACHPGLIDPQKRAADAAKLDALFPMLDEIIAGGHKALVFSQFTEFLGIVRARLDERKTTYEYLDGQTRDRQERVERFQRDPACPLFLISLKAGGVGLNLTAADYVFILDPWWNPAVEAQAIDRTHRIGQTRKVMAYRLVVRDSVEAKILDLQKQKRGLADAIINADNSLIRDLSREDLEVLLG